MIGIVGVRDKQSKPMKKLQKDRTARQGQKQGRYVVCGTNLDWWRYEWDYRDAVKVLRRLEMFFPTEKWAVWYVSPQVVKQVL
jgi:hypothetical protein